MHRIVALLVVVLVLATGGIDAAAQEATPAPYLVAPDPAECTVAPRPIEDVVAVVGTPATGATTPAAASPAPFVVPPGDPADPQTATSAP